MHAQGAAPVSATRIIGNAVTFNARVTGIAGVYTPSAGNVVTFLADGVPIAGCVNLPLNVVFIAIDDSQYRQANCTTTATQFTTLGNKVITASYPGDIYNFGATTNPVLTLAITAAPVAPQAAVDTYLLFVQHLSNAPSSVAIFRSFGNLITDVGLRQKRLSPTYIWMPEDARK